MKKKYFKFIIFLISGIICTKLISSQKEDEYMPVKTHYTWLYGNNLTNNWHNDEILSNELLSIIKENERIVASDKNNIKYGNAFLSLINRYLDRGENEAANNLIEKERLKNKDTNLALTLGEITYLARTGVKDEALSNAKELYKEIECFYTENIFIDMLYLNGRKNEAEIIINKSAYNLNENNIKPKNKVEKELKELYPNMELISYREILANESSTTSDIFKLQESNNDSVQSNDAVINGKLSYGNTPIPHTLVNIYTSLWGGMPNKIIASTYTDESGNYNFPNIPIGEYCIGERIPSYLLEDWTNLYPKENENSRFITVEGNTKEIKYETNLVEKISILNNPGEKLSGDSFKIKWTECVGAKSYDLTIYAFNSGDYYEMDKGRPGKTYKNIKATEFDLPLVDGSIMSVPIFEDNLTNTLKKGITYTGYLDGRDIEVSLLARDTEGEIIQGRTWSKGPLPMFTVNPKEPNKGDKLMLNNDVEEGLKWYKQQLELDGYKKDYIYPILRNYLIKDKVEEDREIYNGLLNKLREINNNQIEIDLYKDLYEDLWRY